MGRARPSPLPFADGLAPLLATLYNDQIDPAPYLVSEKYDGVRALWDGRVLRHRSGRPVSVPPAFTGSLPSQPLDGELWLGRGRFDELSAIVRKSQPRVSQWARVRYMVFEMPAAAGTFAERAERLRQLASDGSGLSPVEAVAQSSVIDRDMLRRRLASVVAGGGEGLMLHLASAKCASGRSGILMKLKPHLDAEAIVVGHRLGTGKYLEVEAGDGMRFLVGSGLTDALRRQPPPRGAVITYRYRDLTPGGVPRFATFVRRYEPL